MLHRTATPPEGGAPTPPGPSGPTAWAGRLTDAVTAAMIRRRRRARGSIGMGIVRKAQIEAVLSVAPIMMAANVVNATALVLLMWTAEGGPGAVVVAWWLVVLAFAARGALWIRRSRRRPPSREASSRAPGSVVVSSLVLAAIWAFPALALLDPAAHVEVAFIASVTAGMVAGGALSLYPVPLAAFAYTAVLMASVVPAVAGGGTERVLPFLLVMTAFVAVVLYAVRHHAGLFFQEIDARLEAERQRDVANLFLSAHQGEGGQCVWEAGDDLVLRSDPEPLRRLLRPFDGGSSRHLPRMLAGCEPRDGPARAALDGLSRGDPSALFKTGAKIRTPSGGVLHLSARALDPQRGGHLGHAKDVTEEVRAREEVEWLASRDALTGLLNRRAFFAAGERMLAELDREGGRAALLFADADNLKIVNDSFGHRAGDEVIRAVARAIVASLPGEALVARKGGDEFVALVALRPGVDAPEVLAARVLDALRVRVRHDGREVAASCSVGATVRGPGGSSLEDMELEADRALYHAKQGGRRRMRFHDEEVGRAVRRGRRLALDVRGAVNGDGLALAFQPILALRTGRVVAAEALLRWRHPEYGLVPPSEVLDMARDEGMVHRLSSHVLARACWAARDWPDSVALSVNLAPSDFRAPDLPGQVEAVLGRAGLPAARLWIEITEAEAIGENFVVQRNIARLRELGAAVAIDDVGAGYSSLTAFDRHAFDVLKIDRSLVSGGASRPNARLILSAIARFAEINRCRVVAEGVETAAELDLVRAVGFELVQGFALHRPMTGEALAALLEDEPPAAADAAAR